MSSRVNQMLVFTLILLTTLASAKKCQNGQILIHKNCVSCTNIKNTESSETNSAPLQDNQCPCKQGFLWSRVLSQCIAFGPPLKQKRLLLDEQRIVVNAQVICNTSSQYLNPGLNKCVCDSTKKYAAVNSSCIYCSLDAFSNGFANELGCICRNGLSWNSISGQCLCPSGSFFIGDTCKTCASAAFPSGVTASDCNSCSTLKGFVTQNLGCFLCVSQNGASTTIVNGSCTCNGIGQVWKPQKGSCSCDWSQLYVTSVNSTGGFSCQKCPYIMSSNVSACPCGISFLQNDPINQICTDLSNDPNSNFTTINTLNTIVSCKVGYKMNYKKYPYICVPGYNVSVGFYSSSTQSYAACSASSNPTGCVSCDLSAGYLLIVDTNECLLCSTVTGATGAAILTGCVCQAGKQWNSIALTCDTVTCAAGTIYQPNSKLCVCDPVKSIIIASKCIPCSSISQSNGYAATNTSCGCNVALFWIGNTTGGICTSTTCNLAKQIVLSNGSCFTCPTNNNGAGTSNGTACKCNNNYIWSPTTTGGSCICDLTKAYSIGTKCVLCSLDTRSNGTGDGKGGCNCLASSTWTISGTTGSCKPCNTQPNIILLGNGSCFKCGISGTFTIAKISNTLNNSCNCTTPLIWNSGGYCDCGTTSAMIISGNSFVCFTCNNATAFTSAKIDSYNCSCVSVSLKWNPAKKACVCADPNSAIKGSGATASCFTCVIGGYIVGTSADQTACLCIGNLVWLPASLSCGCSNSTHIIAGSGVSIQCVSCSTLKYSKAAINSTTCSCLGSGLVFNSSCGGACECPLGTIILPNFTCLACPSGSTPVTPYECLCATGSIWSYASQSCIQCGSAALSNSLSSGGTNFACVCNSGFTWDVMTQTCISSSACPTKPTSSCMKCLSGSASALNTANSRKLMGGALVQGSLNGSFTNYNQIKGYQCSCTSGYSWDSLRFQCFSTGLQ